MHGLDTPYAHNDVKPGNVLITHRKGQLPLAILMDFGRARPSRKHIGSRSEALQLQGWMKFSREIKATLDTMVKHKVFLVSNGKTSFFFVQFHHEKNMYFVYLCLLFS
ncbi:hypothetical protein AHAS_Ahas11G0128100 [Arachis hypogaea]